MLLGSAVCDQRFVCTVLGAVVAGLCLTLLWQFVIDPTDTSSLSMGVISLLEVMSHEALAAKPLMLLLNTK